MREPSRSQGPKPNELRRSQAVRHAAFALSLAFMTTTSALPARGLDCRVEAGVLNLAWGEACQGELAAKAALDLPFEVAAEEFYQFNLTSAALDLEIELRDPNGRLILQKAEPRGSADYLVDMGPRAGRHGGEVIGLLTKTADCRG